METTTMGYIGLLGYILMLLRDTEKEKGNYHNGLHRDYRVCIGIIFG